MSSQRGHLGIVRVNDLVSRAPIIVGCATGLGFLRRLFLWCLFQLSEEAQKGLWKRRGRLVFPQLAERTTHPIDGGSTSRTLFQ
jgi:hypothetical protein